MNEGLRKCRNFGKRKRVRKRKEFLLAFLIGILMVSQCVMPCRAENFANSAGENVKASEARNGVVRILAVGSSGTGWLGSGFGVGAAGEPTDIFVTNWHVVSDQSGGLCPSVYILLNNDAVVYDSSGRLILNEENMVRCEVLGNPVEYPDFAILRAERVVDERVALPLLSVENVEPLEPVFALGYPGTADNLNGLQYLYADIDGINATSGTITRIEEIPSMDNTKVVVHSCEINHGNSGGPLVTSEGAVVGINTYRLEIPAGEEDNRGISRFNSSVVIDYVMDELDALGISYDVFDPNQKEPLPQWVIPAAAAGAALILAVIFLLVRMQKKSREKEAAQAQHMAKQMEKIGAAMGQVQKQAQEAKQEARNAQRQVQNAQQRQQKPTPSGSGIPVPVQGTDSGFRLQGVTGVFAGRRLVIGDRMRIGRDSTANELIYPEKTQGISGRHCELLMNNGQLYLRDLGSSYGTFYKDHRIKPNQAVPLRAGDTFYLAHTKESFRIDLSSRNKR